MLRSYLGILFLTVLSGSVITARAGHVPGALELEYVAPNLASHAQLKSEASVLPSYDKELSDLFHEYGVTAFYRSFKGLPQLSRYYTVEYSVTGRSEEFKAELSAIKGVRSVSFYSMPEVAAAIPNEPNGNLMWYLEQINMNHWDLVDPNVEKIKIAIVDNAIRITHEDIADNLWTNKGEIPGNGIDDDNNGYIDDYRGYDVADEDPNPNPPLDIVSATTFSHGTMVAGLSSATTGNNKGIAAVGLNTEIIPIKCTKDSENPNYIRHGWKGISYAVAVGADIINISWSQEGISKGESELLDLAISKGIILVASAGNHKSELALYPAAHNGVIAVGATANGDKIWSEEFMGSNYGSFIDVMAPGANIFTTNAASDHSYGYASGTSLAAPIVSGFIGLMLSLDPDRNRVLRLLKDGCDNIDIENQNLIGKMGAGRINISRSIELLFSPDPSGITEPKTATIKVFPNPTQGLIHFEHNIQELTVLDLTGREIIRLHPDDDQVDLRNLGLKGLYILRIRSEEGDGIARVQFM